MMRNLFDQYDQPENRITHALASALAADARLLRGFVTWATGWNLSSGPVEVFEQLTGILSAQRDNQDAGD